MQPVRFTANVLKVTRTSPTVCLVELSTKNIPNFSHQPGQFVMVHMEIEGRKINKSYSIASPASVSAKGKIELCIKEVPVGAVSRRMCSLAGNDVLEISGPYGLFVLRQPVSRDIIFAATGTGISSIRGMIEQLFDEGKHNGKEIWLFFGVKNEAEILYRDYFEWLASQNSNFHFVPVLSQPSADWQGSKGYVQQVFPQALTNSPNNCDIYICGVLKSVDDIKQTAEQMGFPKQQIHFEKYV